MELNADFNCRAVVHAATLAWTPSPMPGVERRLLDRIGEEVARATSIVRFAPNSCFSAHTHDGGEEFLVLDGVFEDESGVYPAGSYVRNPPTSRHTPRSTEGCSIFVKLWQFAPEDRTQVRIHTSTQSFRPVADRPGVAEIPLFSDEREQVRLERWEPDSVITLKAPGGIEILVLEGTFNDTVEDLDALSWLRLPDGKVLRAKTGTQGCKLWIKTGHLAHAQTAPAQEP